MNQVAIQCKGVKKIYGSKDNPFEALRGIDLEIDFGQLTLLVGPSGSGKTTLLSIIATLLTFEEGELYLLNHEIKQLSDKEKEEFRKTQLGIVFQSLFLIPTLSVIENIILPLIIAKKDPEEAKAKAMGILERIHLSKYSNTSPALLSKGQQQRVAIARAIINDAKIILCDEPTSALDHVSGFEIMTILHEIASKTQKAVLVVTHDHKIFPFADRIVYMIDGQIAQED